MSVSHYRYNITNCHASSRFGFESVYPFFSGHAPIHPTGDQDNPSAFPHQLPPTRNHAMDMSRIMCFLPSMSYVKMKRPE